MHDMKVHLNLGARDLKKSAAFYATMLGVSPVKQYEDYALFIAEDPGLELALDREADPHISHADHYGLVVDSEQAVEAAIARLSAAGFETDVETNETCCYARQTKVWTRDPDGRRWETYVVHEDTEMRDDGDSCCADVSETSQAVAYDTTPV